MLRVAGRFILDWNPTRQDVVQARQSSLSEFIVPQFHQTSFTHHAAASNAASSLGSPARHVDTAAIVDAIATHNVRSHADMSALDSLVFSAAAAPESVTHDAAPVVPPLNHAMIHIDALSYGPSLISSMAPHAYLGPVGLTAPRLMDDFQ